MLKPKKDMFSAAVQTGQQQRRAESAVSVLLAGAMLESVSVDRIGDRCNAATRKLDPEHVLSLAVSVSAIKHLIQPIATDCNHRLAAGGHRLAALRLLAVSPDDRPGMWATVFGNVPQDEVLVQLLSLPVRSDPVAVNVLPFDSAANPQLALEVEVSENEKRRDYTAPQINSLIKTLTDAGYHDQRGRPTEGGKALGPTLRAITGKSRATVNRYLEKLRKAENVSDEPIAPNPVDDDKRLAKALDRWLNKRREALNGDPSQFLAEELLRIVKPVVPEAPPPQVVDGSHQVDCF